MFIVGHNGHDHNVINVTRENIDFEFDHSATVQKKTKQSQTKYNRFYFLERTLASF